MRAGGYTQASLQVELNYRSAYINAKEAAQKSIPALSEKPSDAEKRL